MEQEYGGNPEPQLKQPTRTLASGQLPRAHGPTTGWNQRRGGIVVWGPAPADLPSWLTLSLSGTLGNSEQLLWPACRLLREAAARRGPISPGLFQVGSIHTWAPWWPARRPQPISDCLQSFFDPGQPGPPFSRAHMQCGVTRRRKTHPAGERSTVVPGHLREGLCSGSHTSRAPCSMWTTFQGKRVSSQSQTKPTV